MGSPGGGSGLRLWQEPGSVVSWPWGIKPAPFKTRLPLSFPGGPAEPQLTGAVLRGQCSTCGRCDHCCCHWRASRADPQGQSGLGPTGQMYPGSGYLVGVSRPVLEVGRFSRLDFCLLGEHIYMDSMRPFPPPTPRLVYTHAKGPLGGRLSEVWGHSGHRNGDQGGEARERVCTSMDSGLAWGGGLDVSPSPWGSG